ncbi:hypothetical protein OG689_21610 [Kitasatospora sp. NBC_00240]|uniref:hypothetical protein n=1 Tax=Kitasatospora sp. NBC_00240 TaxID=2903567 RepID=UPI00224DFF08|nr:hypothetical protein [Kitasatospora sp. NBC_00240]MCX5211853.1 hypothetical protein [Kitasatospora sp. NBC_00240]
MTADDHLLPRQHNRSPYDVFGAAAMLRAEYVGADGYGLAYGSHADGSAHASSDIDLLFVGVEVLPSERLHALTRDVIGLHQQHGLGLDQEVSYASKLHATVYEVEDAITLGGFAVTPEGEVTVDPVVAEPWFLDSRLFRLRLVLNALTVPHVFLGGDAAAYERHRNRAERSVALLALSLVNEDEEFTVHDVLRALTGDPGGVCGEDHLGYDEALGRSPALFSSLQRGMSPLVADGAVSTRDGIHLRQDSDQRRQLLRALRETPVGA